MYVKIENGQPQKYSIEQLRKDNPGVSFPVVIPEDTLAEYSVFPVVETNPPFTAATEVVEESGFFQRYDGAWQQGWSIRPMTAAELQQLNDEWDEMRRRAYQQEADPLFFKWQRGEATKEEWLVKVAEIKSRTF
jgi:hypothetical protein